MQVDERELAKSISLLDTVTHQREVLQVLNKIVTQLVIRGEHHDESKTTEPELSMFAEYGPKLKKAPFGTDEYHELRKQMGEVLAMHYKNNRHHPEHFEFGIDDMTLIDVIEMFADWVAAAKRQKSSTLDSFEHCMKRFDIGEPLSTILSNTVRRLDL